MEEKKQEKEEATKTPAENPDEEPKPPFILSSSPHLSGRSDVPWVMWSVVFALLPSMFFAFLYFGQRPLLMMLVSVLAAVVTEATANQLRGRSFTIQDGSAVLTGLLLALTLPPSLSLGYVVLGSIFAIAIGKQLFGGLGYNIFNPALLGRAFLQASFPIPMTTWTKPFTKTIDAVTTATPLGSFKFDGELTSYVDLLTGEVGGCIGETSAIAIILGGAMLLTFNKYADWRIPVSFLGTVALLGGLFWFLNSAEYPDPVFHLFSGGLLFGAFFMATDMVTSPVTPLGSWIFGIGAGIILIVIRLEGGLPEGVMYAVLFMNGLTPLINRYTRPKFFGEASK